LEAKPLLNPTSRWPLITAWLSIALDSLLQTNPTNKRTWFFVDELHNLKRLPNIEMWLAEIRKFGGCFVGGTQLVSQLNAIYGHETAHTITGLCGTKVIMNVPEPETAKYMSGFLGEKEEISTMESISYGANTVRDGVNIAQQTHKKSSVPFNEIMNLKTGEAFIKFSGIDLVTKTKFKLHEQHKRNIGSGFLSKFTSPLQTTEQQPQTSESNIISLEDYVKSHLLSSNDLLFYGIPLNDEITSKPIYFFDEDTVQLAKFLEDARSKNKRVVVFEDGSKLHNTCFQKDHDILLNPKKGGYAWDMLGEFDGNYARFIETIIGLANMTEEDTKETEIYLAEVLLNIEKITSTVNTVNVLDKLIFQPSQEITSGLLEILGTEDNLKKCANIRTRLALYLNFLKPEKNCNHEIFVGDYVENSHFDSKILFVSCFDDKNVRHIAKLIANYDDNALLKVFFSKTLFMESRNCIIDATKINVIPEAKSTIIASATQAGKMEQAKKLFSETLVPQDCDNENCYFVKMYGNKKIVRV
jgi:hypothetical protein